MKQILTDTDDFERLITQDKVYVDKTAYFHRLIDGSIASNFFISRPRRFGKSLMLSTLEAIFLGRRDLFERDGRKLAIARTDYDWKPYPVIRFDMSRVTNDTSGNLNDSLCELVEQEAEKQGISVERVPRPKSMLSALLDTLGEEKKQAVVLIDEYDAPLQGLLSDEGRMQETLQALHDFYTILKSQGMNIRFLMMAGVSKFAKLSIFSGFNIPIDLTLSPEFAGMLGYTREELSEYFGEHIRALAERRGEPPGRLFDELVDWYDGYRFSPESETKVLNPVSVGRALGDGVLRNYWIETGGSSLIWERLRRKDGLPDYRGGVSAVRLDLGACSATSSQLKPLLFQSGYLTITEVKANGNLMKLGFPNREVRESFDSEFVRSLFQSDKDGFSGLVAKVSDQLDAGDAEGLVNESIAAFFAILPHSWRIASEAEAKRCFFLLLLMIGAQVSAEVQSARGTADMALKTRDVIYVFEFKYGKSAEAALGQIDEKGYAEPYAADGRRVIRVGVNYLPEERTVRLAGK